MGGARIGHLGAMRTLLNTIWLLLAGIWMAISYVVAGLLQLVFIITIPFAIQSFKLAGYALWPFGRVVVHRPDRDVALSTLANIIWFVFAGLWLVLAHIFTSALLAITIVGIPLAVANLKMAGLALAPFGKQVVSRRQLRSGELGRVVVVSEFPDGQ